MKVSLKITKVFAKATGKVKTNTIVLFEFGPIMIGSTMLVGRWEDDASILREIEKGKKVRYTEAGSPLASQLVLRNMAA
jgi:hypothetical protein